MRRRLRAACPGCLNPQLAKDEHRRFLPPLVLRSLLLRRLRASASEGGSRSMSIGTILGRFSGPWPPMSTAASAVVRLWSSRFPRAPLSDRIKFSAWARPRERTGKAPSPCVKPAACTIIVCFTMCRSIKVLRGPDTHATSPEISAAALQFVRKVSGYRKPSKGNQEAFEAAVQQIAAATERLLETLNDRRRPAAP
jgi:hypothetical protein